MLLLLLQYNCYYYYYSIIVTITITVQLLLLLLQHNCYYYYYSSIVTVTGQFRFYSTPKSECPFCTCELFRARKRMVYSQSFHPCCSLAEVVVFQRRVFESSLYYVVVFVSSLSYLQFEVGLTTHLPGAFSRNLHRRT